MGAISALFDTGSTLVRNPVLFVGALLVGLFSLFTVGVSVIPFLGILLVVFLAVFVEPLFAGGFLGMANEALSGRTSLGAFWRHGRENYADLLVARLVLGAAVFAASLVFVVVIGILFALGSISSASPGTDPSAVTSGSFLLAAVVYLVFGLVALVVGLAVQFYPAAIVLGDASPLASFKYSYRLFREHPLSVVGYSVMVVLIVWIVEGVGLVLFVLAMGGIGALTSVASNPAAPDPGAIAGGSVVAAILVIVVGFVGLVTVQIGVLRTYYVAYVRSVVS